MRVSVVVPVYNERLTLREIVRRVYEQAELLHEVIIVDDGSVDGSRERLKELEARYGGHRCSLRAIYKESNEGKGAAVAVGAASVTGDVVVIQDADLEYNPRDYPALLAPIADGRADVVYGSRFTGVERNALMFWHMVANRVLTLLCNLLSNLNLTDVWTGYKVFRANVLCELPPRSKGFGFEPEVTIKVSKLGCRIVEVPIRYAGRTYAEGKKIGAKDAVTGILAMIRAWFSTDLGPMAVGEQTLRIMSKAQNYNLFLYDQVKPFLGRELIEVGSGVGNISRMLLDRDRLVLTDESPNYVDQLRQTYQGWEYVQAQRLDLVKPGADMATASLWGAFDTVVSFQVIEHIEDDAAALKTSARLLRPGGRLVLMVPAHQAIYGAMDKALGHFRRYEETDLREKLAGAGFEVELLRFLNPVAIPGWWLNGKIFGQKIIPDFQLWLFDQLNFLVRWLARFDLRFGLVIFVVARKP
ncbi:MAG: glycosyltransferase [Elusimicrobia bacterium]|nr:glycosyltransferase [Elusimicrobiota bacterium]